MKNCKQLFFTLTNVYEGFTNHFSVNAFIEKLSVMSFKKIVHLTLYQYKMNFKIYTSVRASVVDARLGSKYVSGHTSKCIDFFLPVKKFGFKLANSYPSKNGIMFCTFDKSFTLPDTPILRYTECNTCYTLFILHGKLRKHNLSYKSRNL